ncbi:MAG TPA: helix-turn-helix domain-containing protein [Solirubrobacteraceae bacterium]|nr:helix-turn-helix domain-containing protein [Solirubrobacteraceae bacterium]
MAEGAEPQLLTTAEAAQMLKLRESTLREHTRRGLVPCIRIGRLIRYDAADLAAWLETIKQPARPRS